jgi:hypothetical protein
MIKVGAIVNPASHQNKSSLDRVTKAFAEWPEVSQVHLEGMAGLSEAIDDFARREIGLVIVCGGDGTVQAVLTELFARRPAAEAPQLAVLGRGMTNMIASDVGLCGNPRRSLARLKRCLRAADAGDRVVRRKLLRMENAAGFPPQIGTFFGGAGIYRAIEFCHQKIHSMRIGGELATALTLANLLLRWPLRHRESDPFFRDDKIGIAIDGEDHGRNSYLLVLATTLDRLILNARPFWNQDVEGLRFTTVAYPPRRLAGSVLKVLYGGNDRKLPADCYESHSARSVTLALESPFTLDGQLFQPDPAKPLVLTADAEAEFVRP